MVLKHKFLTPGQSKPHFTVLFSTMTPLSKLIDTFSIVIHVLKQIAKGTIVVAVNNEKCETIEAKTKDRRREERFKALK